MVHHLRNKRGQTAVEYLLLLAAAFITTYLMVTGPIADYASNFVTALQTNMQNFIKNSEWGPDEVDIGNTEHPSAPERLKPMHFDSGNDFNGTNKEKYT